MTTTLGLLQHPRISISTDDQGRNVISYAAEGWGADIIGTYWQEPRPKDFPEGASWDAWRYELTPVGGKAGGRYSHPTETGCKIAIIRHLVDAGYFPPAPDNAHLDDVNSVIAGQILQAWNTFTGRPRVGDFVRLPDGRMKRCAHAWEDGMQLCDGGSFSIHTGGTANMSGSLDPSELWEYFVPTNETQPGRFWFFSHNRAGAGRGVDFNLPCRIYQLQRFDMTAEQAKAHPVATRAAEFWGEGSRDHLRALHGLMHATSRR